MRLFKIFIISILLICAFCGCQTDNNQQLLTKSCSLSINCAQVIDNEKLDKNKKDIVPKDGVIFVEKTVYFKDGESVFDLTLREAKKAKIHIDYNNEPITNSSYIKGIANIYEFDCGATSGWMFKVDGENSNISSSAYKLAEGQKIEWYYSVDGGIIE